MHKACRKWTVWSGWMD